MADEPLMDAPNQQAVRPDQSHPSEEGTGGSQQTDPDDPKRKRSSSRSDPKEESA
jgi:hypothetical protein